MELKEFQNLIRDIYFQRDFQRGLDKTFFWFLEEVGELTRSVRRGESEKIGAEMADVIAWLASVANLLEVDLESAIMRPRGVSYVDTANATVDQDSLTFGECQGEPVVHPLVGAFHARGCAGGQTCSNPAIDA